MSLEEVVKYLATKLGCTHPFRISRALVLLNWRFMEKHGKPAIKFRVGGFSGGFFIEGLKEIMESECFRKDELRKCITYVCDPPKLNPEVESVINVLVNEVKELTDEELNEKVLKDPRYGELLLRGGWV